MSQKQQQAVRSAVPRLVGAGVDTLVINMRYADSSYEPIKQELDKELQLRLDGLQHQARLEEQAVATDWVFQNTLLFLEPHGAGKQWRWLLTCRYLSITIARGTFGDLIAQVRLASEYLWQEEWVGSALYHVHELLMIIFGEGIALQVSELHLCADIAGFDFSQVDYHDHFVTRVRKNDALYTTGVDGVALDCHKVATLRFSSHAAPISCTIYNKRLEIEQKSHKTWFYDLWRRHGWDEESCVWRVEFRFKRGFFRNLEVPIKGAYEVLNELQHLWEYAAGHVAGGADGMPDGWLRYVVPSDDSNRSRWVVHPVWSVVQAAFVEPCEPGLGAIVRKRVREKNIDQGLAAIMGYVSTLAAWLGEKYVLPDTDMSLVLHWLYEHGSEYLASKQRDFFVEVVKKQLRYKEVLNEQQRAAIGAA